MKVVLFCGGLGMRLRDYDENVPKPMVPIGCRPILWHVMEYYAHFGHTDFILCLGYRADVIKNYFRDFELTQSDSGDWRITCVDTGINANIGQRLKAVEPYLAGEAEFLANYSDGLTDLPLPVQLDHFRRHDGTASFLSVRPQLSYHFVVARNDGQVTRVQDIGQTGLRINGGFFILRREIFDHLRHGEDLVMGAFQQLLAEKQLLAYRYDGFWESMDTFRDKQRLDEMYARGDAPWQLWKRSAPVEVPARSARLPIGVSRGRGPALRPH